jgi:hypothetical protein
VDALQGLGARKVGIVAPYLKELTRLVVDYIEDAGIEVGDALSLEVSDNQAVAALDPEDLKTHWTRLDLRDCDALVLSACVQMRSLAAIEDVERHSGLPTMSAGRQRHGRSCARSSWNQSCPAPVRCSVPHPNSSRGDPDCCFARVVAKRPAFAGCALTFSRGDWI